MQIDELVSLSTVHELILHESFGDIRSKSIIRGYSWWINSSLEQRAEKRRDKDFLFDLLCAKKSFETMLWVCISNNLIFAYLNDGDQTLKEVSRQLFFEHSEEIFDLGGSFVVKQTGVIMIAMTEKSITNIIQKKPHKFGIFNHEFHTNENKKEIDNIYKSLQFEKDYINSMFGKDHTNLTGKELAKFCKDKLSLEISEKRGIDIMKLIRPDSSTKETDEDDVQED